MHSQILRTSADFARCWGEIQHLRVLVGVEADVLLNPVHFLAASDETRRPCSVACWSEERFLGLVYATEYFVRKLGTGYSVGGDFTGRGLLLCRPEDEAAVLKEGIRRMAAEGVHSLHLRLLPHTHERFAMEGLECKFLDARIPGDRIALQPTFEDFLAGLGRKTRRNVRAFTRKTQEAGIRFVESLTREEYEDALQRLKARSRFAAGELHLSRDERLLALHGDGLRFGLRSREGALISVLCGFVKGNRFHLLTQFNDTAYERLSLSLVLRGYVIRHLIESGLTEIQFMGGSSLSLGRFCEPQNYRSIFVDKKVGLAAAVKLSCSRVAALLGRLGRPVPKVLEMLCNGFLDESTLSARTALKPAAIVFEGQRLLKLNETVDSEAA